jgi:hypothetical protein
MSEESKSLSLLHPTNWEVIEHYKDFDYAFAFEVNVIKKGWHQGKVAMRGKGTSKRLREAEQSLGSSAWHAFAEGWHEAQKEREQVQIPQDPFRSR